MKYEYEVDPQLKADFLKDDIPENPYYIELSQRKSLYTGFVKCATLVALVLGIGVGMSTFNSSSFLFYTFCFVFYGLCVSAALAYGCYQKAKNSSFSKDKHIYHEHITIESTSDRDNLFYYFDFDPAHEGPYECVQVIPLGNIRHLFLNPQEHLLLIDGDFYVERTHNDNKTSGFMPTMKIQLNFQNNLEMLTTLEKLSGLHFEKVDEELPYWENTPALSAEEN